MSKVYCNECKYFSPLKVSGAPFVWVEKERCYTPQNMSYGNYENRKARYFRSYPHKINENNHCKYFVKKIVWYRRLFR